MSWIFSFVPLGTTSFAWHTQHHLTKGQHHFEQGENIIVLATQMNAVEALPQMMLQQVANDVLRNDIALRANGMYPFMRCVIYH